MGNLTNPTYVSAVLNRFGFTFQKKYGQNFLSDKNLLRAIVDDAFVSSSDTVLEIGPGAGALTEPLLDKAGKVVSVEIDDRLLPELTERFNVFITLTIKPERVSFHTPRLQYSQIVIHQCFTISNFDCFTFSSTFQLLFLQI